MDDISISKRLTDLAQQSEKQNRFTFTDFLNEAECAQYYACRNSFKGFGVTLWGGHPDADRLMLRFGDPEQLGYEEAFPIVCVHIVPLQEKFAEKLTHRDILGAVMHLGIERSGIGDILIDEKQAYVFAKPQMGEYICRELERIRHTSVSCSITEQPPESFTQETEAGMVQVSAPRADSVISKVWHLSRGDSNFLFLSGRVFINGAEAKKSSVTLQDGDKVSVRGYGKFRYLGETGKTKKGNLIVAVEKFV